MYYISSCNLNYFLKFVNHKIKSKMIKSKIVNLTESEKSSDVDDVV
jgi:hypothetical protein